MAYIITESLLSYNKIFCVLELSHWSGVLWQQIVAYPMHVYDYLEKKLYLDIKPESKNQINNNNINKYPWCASGWPLFDMYHFVNTTHNYD